MQNDSYKLQRDYAKLHAAGLNTDVTFLNQRYHEVMSRRGELRVINGGRSTTEEEKAND